jgi:DNA-binding response OmpR family regulator
MRILVAEDNHKLALGIKAGLETDGYAVDVFEDGLEAYDMARGAEYDVLIFDRMMPGMDGRTACERLRADGVRTPLLLLTALDSIENRVEGLDAGADDYVVKPFALEELLARIRSLLRRETAQTAKEAVLTYDTLSLDPAKKEVTRAGHRVTLTTKEFALLEFFMRHAEHVVSSSQLLDHVWDQEYDGVSNIIQVYIKELRKKIDRAFPAESPLFHTVRGSGYKLARVNHTE